MPQPTVTKLFGNPWALSSALAALGTLHSRTLGFLNSLVTLVLASNYYLVYLMIIRNKTNNKGQTIYKMYDLYFKVTVLLINNFIGAKVYCLKVASLCFFCVKWT